MKAGFLLAAAVFSLLAGTTAFADEGDAVKAALKKSFPEAPADSVRKVPYGNLYEVVGAGEIYYTDEKASFLIMGPLIDARTKENVTEVRMRQVNRVSFEALPLDSAIKIVRGNGSRRVAIFEDPNCGYCKRFERDLQGISDITVYVFLYPILAADSMDKSKAVWCSADRGKAWLDIMLRETMPAAADAKCATPLEKNLAFGHDKRIRGTPTIIFEDGDRVPGAMQIQQFEKKLASLKAPAATAAK